LDIGVWHNGANLSKGLSYTSIQIKYKGKTKTIDNIIVVTGAVETILSPDVVEDIGIFAEFDDTIGAFYGIGDSIHLIFQSLSMN
jgi:hypothetical protein